MKTRRAVMLTIFIMSLLNVLVFAYEHIPQGCYTMMTILSAVGYIFDYFFDDNEEK
jgi:hypothetical protein